MSRREFGSLRKLASNRWQASYWMNGVRNLAPMTFATKSDGRRWLVSVETELDRGDWIDPLSARVLFAEWAESWKTTVVDLRPSTIARDFGYVDRYLVPAFGPSELGHITVTDVRKWVAELGDSAGLAPATVVKAGQILNKIMRSAVEAGMLRNNPCADVRLPRIEHRTMRFLSPVEVNVLAATIDKRYRAVIFLAAYGGLRAGELFGLRPERFNVATRSVDVLETLTEVSGQLHVGPPKTKAGRRRVPLPLIVVTELQRHIELFGTGEFLFMAPEGGTVRLSSWRRRFFKPATKAAGLGPLRIHDLRHTAVALWIEVGASPTEIAARAGHSSVSVVLDRYGHLLPGSGERVNDALDRLAAGANGAPVIPLQRKEQAPTEPRRHIHSGIHRARNAHGTHRRDQSKEENSTSPAEKEWALADSNRRPQPCEGCALTT